MADTAVLRHKQYVPVRSEIHRRQDVDALLPPCYQKNCRARLKEKLDKLHPAEVYTELSRYGSEHTAEYMRELEAAHPELIGSVRTNVGDVKCKPRSKRELIELLDMGAKCRSPISTHL